MSKNKGKPQKKHIHYGKGTPAVKSVTSASPKSTEKLPIIEPINFKELNSNDFSPKNQTQR